MPTNGLIFLFLYGLTLSITAQQFRIERINEIVIRIDQRTGTLEFSESIFEDDYGNEIKLRAFFTDGQLLKLESTSRNLGGTVMKSFYFSTSQLVRLDVITTDNPGLPNWEEAKSDELGAEELRRVKNMITEEKQFYLSDWTVIKALPDKNKLVDGRVLKLEVEALLRKLE